MSKLDLDYFRRRLEEEKKILEKELSGLGVKDPASGDWEAALKEPNAPEADPNDAADRFEDFSERGSILNPLEDRLREVNTALDKIKTGRYGLCVICQNQIEEERMEANPAAQTCKRHINAGD